MVQVVLEDGSLDQLSHENQALLSNPCSAKFERIASKPFEQNHSLFQDSRNTMKQKMGRHFQAKGLDKRLMGTIYKTNPNLIQYLSYI